MTTIRPLRFDASYGDLALTVHPVAVSLPDGVALVDVGPPGAVPALEGAIERAGLTLDDVRVVVLTHHDGDHVGALPALQSALERPAVVCAHEREVPYIEGERDPLIEREPISATSVDVTLQDGDTLRTTGGPMRVVETPGHSPGHCSLYLGTDRTLIAGDAVVSDGELSLEGPREAYTPDMEQALASVRRLSEFDVERTVCFHGGAVAEGTDALRSIGTV